MRRSLLELSDPQVTVSGGRASVVAHLPSDDADTPEGWAVVVEQLATMLERVASR
jgi:hypothetical protein